MLWRGARVLLAGAALSLPTFLGGSPSFAQQADPYSRLDAVNAQKDLWQSRLDQARNQISRSSNSLAAAKTKLEQTRSGLVNAKVQANTLQANNPQQIQSLKVDLGTVQNELAGVLKENADRQNKLISDLGANQELIDQAEGQLQATNQQIDYTQGVLDRLGQEVGRIQLDQNATQQQLDVFLRATYKEQRRSLLEYLLDSLSFVDFMTRIGNLQSVAQQQDHLLSLLNTQRQQLNDAQAEQQSQLDTLHDLDDAQLAEKMTLDLQRQNFNQLLEQARVEAQEANERIGGRAAQVQGMIDQKQGELDANQQLLQQLKDAQVQLSSTITNQSDALTKAQEQEQVAKTQLDRLEREALSISAVISQAEAANPPKVYSSGKLGWPLQGTMEQGFGPSPYAFEPAITYQGMRYKHFHTGIDIATAFGTPIRAAADGKVIATNFSSWGYGLHVIVAHSPTLATLYAHMSKLAVTQGQEIRHGQIIGYEGSTGNSTGPHLHFEVRVNGDFVNPLGYL